MLFHIDMSPDPVVVLRIGVQGIQKFVTVAIGTGAGGEGDLQHDKLSKLRTVSSGFESLIFRLPKDAGYQTLVERCESLWQALKQTPSLPTLLVCFIITLMLYNY